MQRRQAEEARPEIIERQVYAADGHLLHLADGVDQTAALCQGNEAGGGNSAMHSIVPTQQRLGPHQLAIAILLWLKHQAQSTLSGGATKPALNRKLLAQLS